MKNRNFKSSTQTKVTIKAGRKSFIHLISIEQLLLVEAKHKKRQTYVHQKLSFQKINTDVLIGNKNQDE